MFGKDALRKLSLNSPLYRLGNMEINKVRYRRGTATRLGKVDEPLLQAVLIEDRPAVIFSREDITAGLVGCPAYNCDGYAPGRGNDGGSAFDIMRNIILFAGEGNH